MDSESLEDQIVRLIKARRHLTIGQLVSAIHTESGTTVSEDCVAAICSKMVSEDRVRFLPAAYTCAGVGRRRGGMHAKPV